MNPSSIPNNSIINLNEHAIRKILKPKISKQLSFFIYETITSTNDFFKNNLHAPSGSLCLSEAQTHGRGRRGNEWHSPFGSHIYASLLWKFNANPKNLTGLSILVALAITTSLNLLFDKPLLKIKWPNDIFYKKKKLAGILIENITQGNNIASVIGFGININHLPPCLANRVCLEEILGQPQNRNTVLGLILNTLFEDLIIFEKKGLEAFLSHWAPLDYLNKKSIMIRFKNHIYKGIARGITEEGYLKLKINKLETKVFSIGDIHIEKC